MHLGDDAKGVECSVCGIVGELMIKDGKVKFAFPPEQLEDADNLVPGKIKHVEDVGRPNPLLLLPKKPRSTRGEQEHTRPSFSLLKPER